MRASRWRNYNKAELQMIKQVTVRLVDDSDQPEPAKPADPSVSDRRAGSDRTGVMGIICDVTYNVLRTYRY